ncbi:phage portal protein [Nicoliella lavandulae]|uniref:Phage portal protein n=1 Tax=Nicoliella lavandulae TaxID=3082954 RepID=A0ABU8SMC2_9LACO
MATTNDVNAHWRSIPVAPNSVHMLNGQRYNDRNLFNSNQRYQVPQATWDDYNKAIKNNADNADFKSFIQWYINDHFNNQVPRIITLQRYYTGDSDIHYWRSDKTNRADNRIANSLPRYITNFNTGLMMGNPVKYGYSNEQDPDDDGSNLLDQISTFTANNDEPTKNKMLTKDLLVTGDAFEMLYVEKGTNNVRNSRINPNTCFVIWSTDVEPIELCAVRYYVISIAGVVSYQVEVYTDEAVYYYDAGEDPTHDLNFTHSAQHPFQQVPITEYDFNDERVGLFEPTLDAIDAYDKAVSEMANSQEDFSNSTLVINGKVNLPQKFIQANDHRKNPLYIDNEHPNTFTIKDKDSQGNENKPYMVKNTIATNSNVMILKPYENTSNPNRPQNIPTSASYLTKSLDANEWQTYINQLLHDIHQFTGTPDLDDQSFAGTQTGAAMAYKLMGSLTTFKTFVGIFTSGLMRRMSMLATYWTKLPGSGINNDSQNDWDNVTVTITPNLPNNVQDITAELTTLTQTGAVSKQTLQDIAFELTGVPSDQEQQRLSDEQDANDERNSNMMQNMMDDSKDTTSIQGNHQPLGTTGAPEPTDGDGEPDLGDD